MPCLFSSCYCGSKKEVRQQMKQFKSIEKSDRRKNLGGSEAPTINSSTLLDRYNKIKMSNNCQIKNCEQKGTGLYATKDLKRGDLVYTCEVEIFDCPNSSHASQVGMDKWVLFTLVGRTMNHSCNPTCGVGFDGANWYYKAFRDIQQGQELTYDYAMANYKIENFPICACGYEKCRREIKGFPDLSAERKKEYKGFYAPYLEEMVE